MFKRYILQPNVIESLLWTTHVSFMEVSGDISAGRVAKTSKGPQCLAGRRPPEQRCVNFSWRHRTRSGDHGAWDNGKRTLL
jgi:hypothetical protein